MSCNFSITDFTKQSIKTSKISELDWTSLVSRLHQTTLCIVNSHLAAHKLEIEKRNEDFHHISHRLEFGQGEGEEAKDSDPRRIEVIVVSTYTELCTAAQDHRMRFWLGDLNYRLNDLRTEEVKKLLADNKLARLVQDHDQLVQERLSGAVFVGWSEGNIR